MTLAARSNPQPSRYDDHEPQSAVQTIGAATVADQLVADLAKLGITTYFGVPGGAIEPLFDALARQEAMGRVRLVPMRSEAGAAFAADGYYRATGKMAVCTATTGPGISNMLTATMAAHADRIPMMLLTPQVALRKQGRGALQESSIDGYDMARVLAGCTRYSTEVTHPDQLPYKLPRALAAARSAPGGPVHLSIPSDVFAGRPVVAGRASLRILACRPMDRAAVDALVRDLLEARSPLLYVGDDAGPDADRLCRLASAIGAKVVSSPAGKRWIGHLDPAYVGVVGFSGHAEAMEVASRADRIVAFGASFDELSTNAWTALPNVPTYAVDRHIAHAHRLPDARPVIAETSEVIDAILEQVAKRPVPTLRPGERAAVHALPRVQAPPPRLVHGTPRGPVHPADLMAWLSRELPSDVVVHVDAGNSFSWSTKHLLRAKPDTYRVAMGLATMCWSIGAVIGAAVAHGRRTVCVTGDGSMLMSSLELTVAVEQNLPVTYVILNDSSLGMVRHGQRLGGAAPIAHEIAPVRFDELARAVGAHGIRVECLADLHEVAQDWIGSDDGGPCIVDVRIDRDAVPPIGDRVRGLAVGVSR